MTGTLDESVARVAAAVIIELACYGELLTADRYRDGFTPWNGRSSSQVAGMRPPAENKTPAVGPGDPPAGAGRSALPDRYYRAAPGGAPAAGAAAPP